MGEQVEVQHFIFVVEKRMLGHAVVGRLVMFKSTATAVFSEGKQEMIAVVMARTIHRPSFANEIGDMVEHLGAELHVLCLIANEIDIVLWRYVGSKGIFMEVLTGDDWRVFKHLYGSGRIVDGTAGRMIRIISRDGLERSANPPASRNSDRGLNRNLPDWDSGRVEKKLLPLQNRHVRRNTVADNAVEMGVDRRHSRRHDQVILIHIDIVAAPRKHLAVGREDDSGNVPDRPIGTVMARKPFRRGETERARCDGYVNLSMVKLAGRVGKIRGDLNGRLLCERERGEENEGQDGHANEHEREGSSQTAVSLNFSHHTHKSTQNAQARSRTIRVLAGWLTASRPYSEVVMSNANRS